MVFSLFSGAKKKKLYIDHRGRVCHKLSDYITYSKVNYIKKTIWNIHSEHAESSSVKFGSIDIWFTFTLLPSKWPRGWSVRHHTNPPAEGPLILMKWQLLWHKLCCPIQCIICTSPTQWSDETWRFTPTLFLPVWHHLLSPHPSAPCNQKSLIHSLSPPSPAILHSFILSRLFEAALIVSPVEGGRFVMQHHYRR